MDGHERVVCDRAHRLPALLRRSRGPIAAVQAGSGPSFEEGEQVLRVLVAAGPPPGTLQQRCRPSNLELISVWSSSQAFEEHLASGSVQAPRSALASRLVAPIDVRPHRLFASGWTTP